MDTSSAFEQTSPGAFGVSGLVEAAEAPPDRQGPGPKGLPVVRLRTGQQDAREIGPLRIVHLCGTPPTQLRGPPSAHSGCVTIEAEHWLVWNVPQGRVNLSDGFTTFTCLRPGCLALLPGGTVWYFDLDAGATCFVLGLHPTWLATPASTAAFDPQAKVIEPPPGLSNLFGGVVAALFQMQPFEVEPDPHLSNVVLQTLKICLRSGTVVHRRGVVLHTDQPTTRPLLDQIVAYVNLHLHEVDLNPTGVADALGVSTSYVHRVFTHAGQGCLGQWIWELRLRSCQADLVDLKLRHLSVETLALSRGFRDVAHFYRRFHQLTGMSPGEWRRRGWALVHGDPGATPLTQSATAQRPWASAPVTGSMSNRPGPCTTR